MDLTGKRVVHKAFGEGVIVQCDAGFVSVEFENEVKKFQFPTVFQTFLKAEDSDVELYVSELLAKVDEEKAQKAKAEEEEKERQERHARRKLEEQKANAPKSRSTVRKSSASARAFSTKVNARANIAFKCNYCDGGKSEHQIGYDGVCSDKVLNSNIAVEHKTWCCSPDSACLQYHNGEISRKELDDLCSGDGFVCYESQMLRDWRALAGLYLKGDNKGKPKAIKNVMKNSLCVLTTRDPKHAEDLRYIFAVFLIDETYEGGGRDEGYVSTESEFKIKLSPVEARSLRFWKYYKNENNQTAIKWGSGLYRYIGNEEAAEILKDIANVKKNTQDEDLANRFYKHFCTINGIREV